MTKCEFCSSTKFVSYNEDGVAVCVECASKSPVLVGQDDKAQKLADLMLETLEKKASNS